MPTLPISIQDYNSLGRAVQSAINTAGMCPECFGVSHTGLSPSYHLATCMLGEALRRYWELVSKSESERPK